MPGDAEGKGPGTGRPGAPTSAGRAARVTRALDAARRAALEHGQLRVECVLTDDDLRAMLRYSFATGATPGVACLGAGLLAGGVVALVLGAPVGALLLALGVVVVAVLASLYVRARLDLRRTLRRPRPAVVTFELRADTVRLVQRARRGVASWLPYGEVREWGRFFVFRSPCRTGRDVLIPQRAFPPPDELDAEPAGLSASSSERDGL